MRALVDRLVAESAGDADAAVDALVEDVLVRLREVLRILDRAGSPMLAPAVRPPRIEFADDVVCVAVAGHVGAVEVAGVAEAVLESDSRRQTTFILEASGVLTLDADGASALCEFVAACAAVGHRVILSGLAAPAISALPNVPDRLEFATTFNEALAVARRRG